MKDTIIMRFLILKKYLVFFFCTFLMFVIFKLFPLGDYEKYFMEEQTDDYLEIGMENQVLYL